MTIMLGISQKMKPSIKFFMFLNFSDGTKSTSLIKSHRNFEGEVVGLGIVAAMNEIEGTHEAFPYVKSSRAAAKPHVSVKSKPIPIVSSKPPVASFRESSMEKVELMEMSESYTLVISHVGNGKSVRKGEYCFDVVSEGAIDGDFKGRAGGFFASPVKNTEAPRMYWTADFLSSCYLCRKKLHGLDIFMYRGDQAFCSVECRCKQILNDERKELEKCGSDALKPLDSSGSPCSAPIIFSAGVAAA